MSLITDEEVRAAVLKHDWTVDLATPEYQAKAMAKMRAVLEAGGRDQWLIRAALEAAANVADDENAHAAANRIRYSDPATILATLEK